MLGPSSTGSTPVKVSTTDYIQCEQVSGTNGTVVTNLYYNIVEKVSGRAVYGNYYKNGKDNHCKVTKWAPDADGGKYTKWTLQKADGDEECYNIIEKVSGRALYGSYYNDHKRNDLVQKWPLSQNDGKYSKWTLQKADEDEKYYNIIEKFSGRALYGTAGDRKTNYLVQKWPLSQDGGKYSKWSFIPVDYSLSAEINSYEYIGDIKEVIDKNKTKFYIDEHVLEVDEYATGSSISKTFTKETTDTFSWGMDQRLGIKVSVEAHIGIPFIGGVSTTTETSFEYGFNQQWTDSKTYTVSSTASLVVETAGRYKMTGWGDIANVKMPYKAKALLKAKHGDDYVSGYGVKALFLHEGLDAKIIQINADSILAEVSGTLDWSYCLQTYTSIEKLD